MNPINIICFKKDIEKLLHLQFVQVWTKFLLIFVIESHLINWSNNNFFFPYSDSVDEHVRVFPINAGCYLWFLFLFLILFIYELVSSLSTQGANIVYECLSMWRFYNLREAREFNYKRRSHMFLQLLQGMLCPSPHHPLR